jgi:signal transduction protein with GAF and PtsI domain
MPIDSGFLDGVRRIVSDQDDWDQALGRILERFNADSGTIHLLGDDGLLYLKCASAGIPQVVLDTVRTVPVGKGMAGLAVERRQPVNACNIQTDTSGDVRPGARATGLQGSIVVPILVGDAAIGALGIANLRERTFTDEEAESLMEVGRVLGQTASGMHLR